MKNLQHKVCIFGAETVKTCSAASEYIFYVSANVWLLLGVFQCFFNVQLLLKDINERLLLKENVQLIFFFCLWLLLETFQCFLMNVRLLLKIY